MGVTPNTKPCWQSCLGVDGGWGLLYNGQLGHNGTFKPFRVNPSAFERVTYNNNDTVS